MFIHLKDFLKTIVPRHIKSQIRTQLIGLHCEIYKITLQKKPILEKPIFLIGAPRSGTTLSTKLFSIHPMVANWSEAGRVWDNKNYNDRDADHFWGEEKVTQQDIKRIHSRFECFRQIKGKDRFVNKHPRNSVRIDYILKIFPDALFVHVIRDGRAVVNSIMRRIQLDSARQNVPFGDFCKPPNWRQFIREDKVAQAALQWREIVKYILSKRNDLGDSYYEYKYEDLCSDPRKTLTSVFQYAGLSVSDTFMNAVPEKYKNMNYKYKEVFSDSQIKTINSIQYDLLKELGYER